MNEIATQSLRQSASLHIAGCLASTEETHPIAGKILNLPRVYEVTPDFYNSHTIRFPSLLRSLDIIAKQRPDKIVISTPGPVGIIAWLASRLLGIPCTGIYHTDFATQFEDIVDDKSVVDLTQRYIIWFYNRMDEVRVPSNYYMTKLADQGIDRSCLKLFKRGLDGSFLQISDLFVFPSDTDTFGMSVLEAQSLGLPAIVSRKGGPMEIIRAGVTGYAHASDDIESWVSSCEAVLRARIENPASFQEWRSEIQIQFKTSYSWEALINTFTTGRQCSLPPPVKM